MLSQKFTNFQGHNCECSKRTNFLMGMTHLHLEFISYDRICPISMFIRPSRSQDFLHSQDHKSDQESFS